MISEALVDLHYIWEQIGHDLNDLESKRGNVHESNRALLEEKIGKRKEWMKTLKKIELNFRDDLFK
jgi:hypothetical protein